MPTELLTTSQVADMLGKSVTSVSRYVRDGLLTATMQLPGDTGARLFHPAEVERFRSANRDYLREAAS